MAQVVSYINGFETGAADPISAVGSGSAVTQSNVRSGAYAWSQTATLSRLQAASALGGATLWAARFSIYIPTLPSANTNIFIEEITGGTTARLILRLSAANKLNIVDNAATLGLTTATGATTISANVQHLVEITMDCGAGGAIKVWLDGNLEINTTHTSSVTGVGSFRIQGVASPNQYIFDDIRIDTGGTTRIGDGICIARQGGTGTRTYDAWTKTGGFGTVETVWSNTPFNAASNCNSSTSGAAQTMSVGVFSATQTGHGTQVIRSGDTINAVKVAVIAKVGSATTMSIRRRVNSVDTDISKTLTTSDAYYESAMFTTTTALLDAMEAGVVKAANATLTTVEDVWVIVDFSYVAIATNNTVNGIAGAVGTCVNRTGKIVSGTSAMVGTLGAKVIAKAIAGVSAMVSSVVRVCAKSFSASAGNAPTVVLQTRKHVSGSTTASIGTVVRQTGKVSSGSAGVIGTAFRAVGKIVSCAIDLVGTTVQNLISGGVVNFVTVNGILGTAGLVSRQAGKIVSGVSAMGSSVFKRTTKSPIGSLGAAGSVVRQTGKVTSGQAANAPTVARQTGKRALGSLSLSGSTLKSILKSINGSSGLIGTCKRATLKTCNGTLGLIGTVIAAAQHSYTVVVSGILGVSGGVVKAIRLVRSGNFSLSGSVSRAIAKTVTGNIPMIGVVMRGIALTISATTVAIGTVRKDISKSIDGVISAVGTTIALLIGDFFHPVILKGRQSLQSLRGSKVGIALSGKQSSQSDLKGNQTEQTLSGSTSSRDLSGKP